MGGCSALPIHLRASADNPVFVPLELCFRVSNGMGSRWTEASKECKCHRPQMRQMHADEDQNTWEAAQKNSCAGTQVPQNHAGALGSDESFFGAGVMLM